MSLYSLQRKPRFDRSASMLTAGVLCLLVGMFAFQLGLGLGVDLLLLFGGLAAVVGIVWTVQGVYRLAANVDVAAEAVYARFAEHVEE